MLRAICRFSRGAQFVLIYRYALATIKVPRALRAKGGKCTLPAALLTVQRRFALAATTAINLARNYAFLRNTFCTLHDNLLRYAKLVQQTVRCFFSPSYIVEVFREYYYTLRVVPVMFPLLGINIFQLQTHNEAGNCVHWLFPRDMQVAIK